MGSPTCTGWSAPSEGPPKRCPRSPGLERTRLADAVRQVLHRAATTGRLLVVVDDLQDVDDVSLEILGFVLNDRHGARVPSVLGLRADRGASLPAGVMTLSTLVSRLATGTRVDLCPLTRPEVASQLAGILAGPPPESLTTLAHGLSGGSPGLVRLLVAELRRRGPWSSGPGCGCSVRSTTSRCPRTPSRCSWRC